MHEIPTERLTDQLDRWLDRVDQFIWPGEHRPDTECLCFYTFKPFPGDLTPSQTDSWAQLQCNSLSPFESGDHYYYLSSQGLHLWITKGKFAGLPETAAQARLEDGSHLVSGALFQYRQTWSDGVMTACVTLPTPGKDTEQTISFSQPWAVKRRLDDQIRSPNAWVIIIAFVFLSTLSWVATGFLTLYTQQQLAERSTQTLNASIGEKLAKQTQLKQRQDTMALLHNWRESTGFLPESFGRIAARINSLGKWNVREIAWQDRQLLLELETGNIDIATLIADLEDVSGLRTVGIRPHGSGETFLLEADFNE